ncbi:hypothetical protein HDU67_002682 [Dinochytrium kinnereticum]|nr:hypothetical protein HDU67_002682 [Dinochytrium kinnereticum]
MSSRPKPSRLPLRATHHRLPSPSPAAAAEPAKSACLPAPADDAAAVHLAEMQSPSPPASVLAPELHATPASDAPPELTEHATSTHQTSTDLYQSIFSRAVKLRQEISSALNEGSEVRHVLKERDPNIPNIHIPPPPSVLRHAVDIEDLDDVLVDDLDDFLVVEALNAKAYRGVDRQLDHSLLEDDFDALISDIENLHDICDLIEDVEPSTNASSVKKVRFGSESEKKTLKTAMKTPLEAYPQALRKKPTQHNQNKQKPQKPLEGASPPSSPVKRVSRSVETDSTHLEAKEADSPSKYSIPPYYLHIKISTARALALSRSTIFPSSILLHLVIRLVSSLLPPTTTPPVPYMPPFDLDTGRLNPSPNFDFSITLPLALTSTLITSSSKFPAIVEVWASYLGETDQRKDTTADGSTLIGLVRLPVNHLLETAVQSDSMMRIAGPASSSSSLGDEVQEMPLMIPETEYCILDPFSGSPKGWLKSFISLGTWKQTLRVQADRESKPFSPDRRASDPSGPRAARCSPDLSNKTSDVTSLSSTLKAIDYRTNMPSPQVLGDRPEEVSPRLPAELYPTQRSYQPDSTRWMDSWEEEEESGLPSRFRRDAATSSDSPTKLTHNRKSSTIIRDRAEGVSPRLPSNVDSTQRSYQTDPTHLVDLWEGEEGSGLPSPLKDHAAPIADSPTKPTHDRTPSIVIGDRNEEASPRLPPKLHSTQRSFQPDPTRLVDVWEGDKGSGLPSPLKDHAAPSSDSSTKSAQNRKSSTIIGDRNEEVSPQLPPKLDSTQRSYQPDSTHLVDLWEGDEGYGLPSPLKDHAAPSSDSSTKSTQNRKSSTIIGDRAEEVSPRLHAKLHWTQRRYQPDSANLVNILEGSSPRSRLKDYTVPSSDSSTKPTHIRAPSSIMGDRAEEFSPRLPPHLDSTQRRRNFNSARLSDVWGEEFKDPYRYKRFAPGSSSLGSAMATLSNRSQAAVEDSEERLGLQDNLVSRLGKKKDVSQHKRLPLDVSDHWEEFLRVKSPAPLRSLDSSTHSLLADLSSDESDSDLSLILSIPTKKLQQQPSTKLPTNPQPPASNPTRPTAHPSASPTEPASRFIKDVSSASMLQPNPEPKPRFHRSGLLKPKWKDLSDEVVESLTEMRSQIWRRKMGVGRIGEGEEEGKEEDGEVERRVDRVTKIFWDRK